MGTTYRIYREYGTGHPVGEGTTVDIDEMSNKLSLEIDGDIYIHGGYENRTIRTPELEPSEMLKLLMEGIKATSYWMSEKEFNEIFSKLETYPY